MKIYRKTLNYRIKFLGILLFLLILPVFLNTLLFKLYNSNYLQKNDEKHIINPPKLNAPPNANYFTYFKTITIDHNQVAGSVSYTNFPVLLSIKDPDLRFDVQPDGDDIAFSIENEWVDHELELFNQIFNATHTQLIAWVLIPSLSGNFDTIIRMY